MGFAEGEAHLTNMLKPGVIHPSTSDWYSVPVLFRKKDGGVHWCVERSNNYGCVSTPTY